MRVGVFTDSYRPYMSGVVRSIETFRAELEAEGFSFFIFAPNYPGAQPEERVFRFRSLPAPTNPEFTLAVPFSRQLGGALKNIEPDIIHVHSPFILGWLGARWARRLGIPLVFTYHTLYEEYVHYFPLLQAVAREVTRKYTIGFCSRCDLVLAPTAAIREYLLQSGVQTRVESLPTGIDLASFQGGDGQGFRRRYGIGLDEPVLLYVGRMGKEKNIGFLLRTFRGIRERVEGVWLVLVGGGPAKEELAAEAEKLGVADRALFTGPVPPERVKDCYAAGNIFVISSLTETQGLVVGEAKAAGLPAVAVRAQGVSEMVNEGVDGFLTPLEETAFAAKVCELLSNASLYQVMKGNALTQAEEIAAPRMAQRLKAFYQELCTINRSGGVG
ncbi:MAG TPA: glycosyltransferase family 4 protein [Desulfotomaculum sp.]|nr:glycosyltransferase family 4 protein [Desulfotomaculum sp.]